MAANPLWRQPLRAWRRLFTEFITTPAAGGPLGAMIFFDFRVVHGDPSLGEQLRDHVVAELSGQRVFLNFVANQVVSQRPPVGFFGAFVVEKSGEHKDLLNLKARGINPLVDLVRFFALERGARSTGTLERIAELREQHTLVGEWAEELAAAFEFIRLLRIHSHYRQLSEGAPLDSFIDPERLTALERRTLKEAFHLISRLQDQVLERYKAAIL
jgi:CBS domain-containing protein